jgi:membrane protein DedA with SNARE-associated domain
VPVRVGKMDYRWFLTCNIVGPVLWILAFTLAGYFLGSLPVVQQNFSYIIYAIIGISLFAVGSIICSMLRPACPTGDAEQNTSKKQE